MPLATRPLLVDRDTVRSGTHSEYSRRQTIGLVIGFTILATFAPAIGIPPMFVLLWAYSNANVIVHRACLSIAVLLAAYGVLFLNSVVTFAYWQ